MHLFFLSESVLRVSARKSLRGIHAMARFHFFDAIADRFNQSRGIRTGRVGKRRFDCVSARAHVGVVGIHASSVDADENLSSGEFWRRDFLELQDFGAAELMNQNCFHWFSPAEELANAKKWCQRAVVKEKLEMVIGDDCSDCFV